MDMSNNWKVFVVFHKMIIDSCHENDKSYDAANYTYFKCNDAFPIGNGDAYDVIKESSLEFYDKTLQERTYMAPSAIYHVYKNKLYEGLDRIGFIEYDIEFSDGMTADITNRPTELCYLSPKHELRKIVGQSSIRMNGVPCCKQIVDDYNEYFQKDYDYEQFAKSTMVVTSQQSFLVSVDIFEKIMAFITMVIESRLAERPKSWHRPSTLMDRYFAICLHIERLEGRTFSKMDTTHLNRQLW